MQELDLSCNVIRLTAPAASRSVTSLELELEDAVYSAGHLSSLSALHTLRVYHCDNIKDIDLKQLGCLLKVLKRLPAFRLLDAREASPLMEATEMLGMFGVSLPFRVLYT
jgi:hypothetical protein